jgi:tRNA A-37 threonylcarbamoyl transferase component Bud32
LHPDFIFRQRGDAAIWLNVGYDDDAFVERLRDADGLFADTGCQIVKDEMKTKVGRLSLSVAGATRSLFVKRYNAFSLRHKLASPFVHSGAFRSLRGAAILGAANIACARPVAAVENRRAGALMKCFFITEEITGGMTVDARWRQQLRDLAGQQGVLSRRSFLAQLARLFNCLHAAGIYHNDLKDANILAVSGGSATLFQFALLDLDGVASKGRLNARRKIKNLVQINRTLGRHLRRSDKLFFLKSYLGAAFAERRARRELMVSVLQESDSVDRRKACRA